MGNLEGIETTNKEHNDNNGDEGSDRDGNNNTNDNEGSDEDK